eukprot:13338892-Alexandrium_andersonii.AAC.1
MAARARRLKHWARQPGVAKAGSCIVQAPPSARVGLWQWLKEVCKATGRSVCGSSRARGNARQHPAA